MEKITIEQYKELRRRGFSQENIRELQQRDRVYETLQKESFEEKGLLRSAAEFLNMDEFGRGIGQTIFNVTGEAKRNQQNILDSQQKTKELAIQLLKNARESGDTQKIEKARSLIQTLVGEEIDFEELATGGLSSREVVGSATSTALNVASLGGALGLGAQTAKGSTSLLRAGVQGAQSAALSGALFGGAEALTEGEGVLEGTTKGAALGAAFGASLGVAAKYIDDLTKITPQSRLFQTKDEFKTLKRVFNEGVVYQGKGKERKIISDPINTIIQSGAGNKLRVENGKIKVEQAREFLRKSISEIDEEVTDAVSSSNKIVKLSELKKQAIEEIKNNNLLKSAGKVGKTISGLDNYFEDFSQSFGNDIPMKTASSIRRAMNREFNPDTVDVERAIGDVMRKVIYKNVPGAREALAKEGQLIVADKFLDALENKSVKGGPLGNYFAGLIGAMVGSTVDIPVAGPVAGALGARQIQEFMQRTQIDPIAPKVARAMSTLIERLPTDAAGNVSKTAILNLIAQMSVGGQLDNQ